MKMSFNTKYIGAILIALGVVLSIVIYLSSQAMLKIADMEHGGSCQSSETCPHVTVLTLTYPGYFVSLSMIIIGIFLVIFGGSPEKQASNESKWQERSKTLKPDEKEAFDILASAGGVMFQSELAEKTGFPKAKLSRVLDRLEARGLLERKRRGMTNAIVLK